MKKLTLLLTTALLVSGLVFANEPYKPGDNATDFTLKNLKGNTVSLSQYEDAKGFIVVFTCNTCPFVKKYEKRIIDLHEKFSSKGYPVVAINSNDPGVSPGDSYEEMQRLAKEKGFKFEYLYDENQQIAKQYGATNTPHVYVLSKQDDGTLRTEYVGAIDNNADDESSATRHYVQDAVNSLLKGNEVPVGSTKAVGCGIKWKKA